MTIRTETQHDTIVLARAFGAPVRSVFAAWSDTEALERWCCPGDRGWTSKMLEHDFRVGGRKVMAFGPPGEESLTEDTRYLDIVLEQRIICAETILRGTTRISASLITVEFAGEDGRTALTITDQIAVLDRADSPAARRHGWGEVLGKLVVEVAAQ